MSKFKWMRPYTHTLPLSQAPMCVYYFFQTVRIVFPFSDILPGGHLQASPFLSHGGVTRVRNRIAATKGPSIVPASGALACLGTAPFYEIDGCRETEAQSQEPEWASSPRRISQKGRLRPRGSAPPLQCHLGGPRPGPVPWLRSRLSGRCLHLSIPGLLSGCPLSPTLRNPSPVSSRHSISGGVQ